jgi:fructose-bisphosphate aldolase class I
MILKPNMVISGKKSAQRAEAKRVAEATVRTLKRLVPSAVPGIAFLSGGQSAAEATVHLNLMNQMGSLPWALSFSYGRALQDEALRSWGGKADNLISAQQAFIRRAKFVGQATTGHYDPNQEQKAA